MTERFTKEQFEAALPKNSKTGAPLFVHDGYVGQETYRWTFAHYPRLSILVLSTIDQHTGMARPTDKDSIRVLLQYRTTVSDAWGNVALGRRSCYITRQPGWANRLQEMIKMLRITYVKAITKPIPDNAKVIGFRKEDRTPFAIVPSSISKDREDFVNLS